MGRPKPGLVRRKLLGAIAGRGGRGSRRGGRGGDGWRRSDGRGCRNRTARDGRHGGRVLSEGRGASLGLRSAPGRGTARSPGRNPALRRLRPARHTPPLRHPPELPQCRTLRQLKRPSRSSRQPHVGGKRRRRRGLQQRRANRQYQQPGSDSTHRFCGDRPLNPQTSHNSSIVESAEFSPAWVGGSGGASTVPPPAPRRDSRPRRGHKVPPPRKRWWWASGEVPPDPPYATASRNSAMSASCESTQSPGFRE